MRSLLLFFAAAFAAFAHAQVSLPFDFETEATTPAFADFEAAITEVVANPAPSDINPSATVAQMVREAGGEIWAGTLVTLPAYLDLTEVGAFRMKVWAPLSGSVMKLKLEGSGVAELDAITTVAGEWQELEWDFTGLPAGIFNQIAFMLDFGLYGDGTTFSTFYFDDVELFDGAGDLIQVDLPITHEDANTHYQTTSFAGNFSELAADPADAANTAMKVTKHWLALDYSGTTVSTPLGLANPIPFEPGYTSISVDVYSPTAGIAVRLKAEEYLDQSHSVETQVVNTSAYEWETLTFDLSQPVPGTQTINFDWDYTILSIFFDFGNPGYLAGTTAYYYDNVVFNGNPASIPEVGGRGAWLYPNWVNPNTPIRINATDEWQPLDIFSVHGQLVHTAWVQGASEVRIDGLAPGTYVCRLGGTGGATQKLVVTREQ